MTEFIADVKHQNQEAVRCMKAGQMDDANAFLQKSLHQCISALNSGGLTGADMKEVRGMRAATLNNLGCLFKRMNANQEALRYLLEARDIEADIFGTAGCSTLVNLSTVLAAVGSLDDALTIAKQCVKLAAHPNPKLLGPDGAPVPVDDYMVVLSLHNLAVTQQQCGPQERKLAGTTMHRALREAQERLGVDHPTTKLILAKTEVKSGVKQPPIVPRPPPGANSSRPSAVSREHAQQALRGLQFSTPDAPVPLRLGSRGTSVAQTLPPVSSKQDVMAGAVFTKNPDTQEPPLKPKDAAAPQQQQQQLQQPTAVKSPVTPTVEAIPTAPTSSATPVAETIENTPSTPLTSEVQLKKETQQQLAQPRKRQPRLNADGTVADPPFARFALNRRKDPPPVPITFAEIRTELQLSRVTDPTKMNAGTKHKVREETAEKRAQHIARLAQSRKEKLEREQAEEALARQQRARKEDAQRREEERARRAEAALQKRRDYAARVIQDCFRRWYFNARAKRPRVVTNRGTAKYGGEGASDPLRIVKKCARKWLDKTAGARLAVRILGSKKDFSKVQSGVRAFQLLWRRFVARKKLALFTNESKAEVLAVVEYEKQAFAAMVIQAAYRRHRAKFLVQQFRERHYREFVMRLQRWGRRCMQQRDVFSILLGDIRRQNKAALSIQTAWRRYQAVLLYSVMLLKKKVNTMRRREQRAAVTMQRAGRGYNERKMIGKMQEANRTRRLQQATSKPSSGSVIPPSTMPSHLERFLDKTKQRDAHLQLETDRDLYMELAVQSQRAHLVSDHSPKVSRRELDMKQASEQHRRELELNTLRRFRSAKLIQRMFRRWRTLDTDEKKERRVYMRAKLQKEHFDAKEVAAKEKAKRSTMLDLAKDAREMRQQWDSEVEAAGPVRTHLPDEVLVGRPVDDELRLREIQEREQMARALKDEERRLEQEMAREAENLRTMRVGGKTFRTIRERRQEDKSTDRFSVTPRLLNTSSPKKIM